MSSTTSRTVPGLPGAGFPRAGKPRQLTGHYVIVPLDNDREYSFYWHAYVGDLRVNGGVCKDYTDGVQFARRAIAVARHGLLSHEYYWDLESQQWVRKGELPPI